MALGFATACVAEPLASDDEVPPPAEDTSAVAETAAAGSGVGAHGIVVQPYGSGHAPAQITLSTAASGSTFLVALGGKISDIDNGPTDNKGNTYSLLGSPEQYADWPGYGSAVWIARNAKGGAGHVWSQYVTSWDEVTMFVVELPAAGTNPAITSAFSQRANSGATSTQTSNSVTTTREARELAFWFGAGPVGRGNHVVSPNNSFTKLQGYGYDDPNGYVQAWMAYRAASAGTHNVTWSHSPIQGAQLRLVALQP